MMATNIIDKKQGRQHVFIHVIRTVPADDLDTSDTDCRHSDVLDTSGTGF